MGTIVDDRDPSITYNSNHWGFEENQNEVDGTSTFCNIVGGTATYHFSGPAIIRVFGTIQASNVASGRSTYSIDGGTPQAHVPLPQSNPQFNVKFFESSVPSGSHTLVITTLDGPNVFVYLDYIQVVSQPSPTTAPPPPPQQPDTSTVTLTATNVVTATLQSSSNTPAKLDGQSSSGSGTTTPHSGSSSIPTTLASGSLLGTSTHDLLQTSLRMVTITGSPLPASTSASSPAADTTSTPQVAATTHHVSLAMIIGPIIGALVIITILLVAGICYARAWRRRVLISKSDEAAAAAPSDLLPSDAGAVSTPPAPGALSRWIPGSASRQLTSVSPFVLSGEDHNAGEPPPYYAAPTAGKYDMMMKQNGSSTALLGSQY
ncbi:hypothetical protein D9613_008884 [Agrocybe pediades]|uniref:Uncharacterized protein n=1 Tax=Agrocybe pediades TaxID=84607 RepID=A0A8H4QTN9_9AGAR|nr:hypothetical protein D9613_008884 [Agrocybe pediades]